MNLRKSNALVLATIISVALFGLFACSTKQSEKKSGSEEYDQAAEDLKENVNKVLHELPPPSKVPGLLQETGVDYNPNLVNEIGKVESYKSTPHKAAINLGVYAVDIAYLSHYEKVQKALDYLEASMDIGEYLGLKNAIDMSMVKRFENNLSEEDSLANIVNEVIAKADQYLQESSRNNVAALMLGGTFIEGLYISTQLVKTYPKDILPEDSRNLILTPLIETILKQEKPLSDLIAMLEKLKTEDEWVIAFINSLKELDKNFNALNIDEKIHDNKGSMVLSDETLEMITLQTEKIRANFTH